MTGAPGHYVMADFSAGIPVVDCAIVGAGPAGLIAAVYLARFRRSLYLIDAGASRAMRIPTSHNLPGFPNGISGRDFLGRLTEQAAHYGVHVLNGEVMAIQAHEGGFSLLAKLHAGPDTAASKLCARNIILATGAIDIEPEFPGMPQAVQHGHLRHCPICDGYEVIDQQVGIIGSGQKLASEALFLRDYTDRLSVFGLLPGVGLSARDRRQLQSAGVSIIDAPVLDITTEATGTVALHLSDGIVQRIDTLYSALGSRVRSELASALGVQTLRNGDLQVDRRNMSTSVPGLYAAGDVVNGLSQISVAAGHAALAATAIHHRLRRHPPKQKRRSDQGVPAADIRL